MPNLYIKRKIFLKLLINNQNNQIIKMKDNRIKMTLAEYLQSTNLKRKVQSLSKQKQKTKNNALSSSTIEDRNTIDYLSLNQNRKLKTQFQRYIDQLKMVCRQLIKNDSQYIRVLRLAQNLSQIFQKQLEQVKKDNSFIKSYLLQGSFLNSLQIKKSNLKHDNKNQFSSLEKHNKHKKDTDFVLKFDNNQNSQRRQSQFKNLRVDGISQCPRLSLMSKFDENKNKEDQGDILNYHQRSSSDKHNQINTFTINFDHINHQPPRINIRLADKNIYKQDDQFLKRDNYNLNSNFNKKYNPQHSTNQNSQEFIKNINIQSPAKRSVIWQQNKNSDNKNNVTLQKPSSVSQMVSLHTPTTFHKNSQRVQNNSKRYQFSDRQNSVSIRRYQNYKRIKNNQTNQSTALNSKTSIK